MAYKAAKPIGSLRWISFNNSLNIAFKSVDIAKYVDIFKFETDIDTLLNAVIQNKSNGAQLNVEDVRTKVMEVLALGIDEKELCCGHDIVYILYEAIRMRWAKKRLDSISLVIFSKDLCNCYEFDHFKNTNIWRQINNWKQKRSMKQDQSDVKLNAK